MAFARGKGGDDGGNGGGEGGGLGGWIIALKGGELREPGLAILAGRLAQRVSRTVHVPDWLAQSEGENRRCRIKIPGFVNLFRPQLQ
eukprot:5342177-Prymnesium_polylepis.1